jgi:hypothetical protein
MKLFLCFAAASVSVSLFGADTDKVEYYKVTFRKTTFEHITLMVPKLYFDRVCSSGTARKWIFGVHKKHDNKRELEIMSLDFWWEDPYTPGKNKATIKVENPRVRGIDLEIEKIQCKAEKHAVLKYIEEHGEEEFRKLFPGPSAEIWDKGLT